MYANHPVTSVSVFSVAEMGAHLPLSLHFTLGEFACHDGADVVLVHPALLHLLEELRGRLGNHPVTIESGYRTPSHNAAIRGKQHSRHLFGMAADIKVKDVSPATVADMAEQLGAGGVGRYASFTHVDVWGNNRRW